MSLTVDTNQKLIANDKSLIQLRYRYDIHMYQFHRIYMWNYHMLLQLGILLLSLPYFGFRWKTSVTYEMKMTAIALLSIAAGVNYSEVNGKEDKCKDTIYVKL